MTSSPWGSLRSDLRRCHDHVSRRFVLLVLTLALRLERWQICDGSLNVFFYETPIISNPNSRSFPALTHSELTQGSVEVAGQLNEYEEVREGHAITSVPVAPEDQRNSLSRNAPVAVYATVPPQLVGQAAITVAGKHLSTDDDNYISSA